MVRLDNHEKRPTDVEMRTITMNEITDLILFNSSDGKVSLSVAVKDETVWLNRSQMSILFGRDIKTIGKHIANARREELAGKW